MVAINSAVVKKVAALLEEGDETPLALAKAVVELVDEVRAERSGFCIVTEVGKPGSVMFNAFGPFSTQNQAFGALKKGLIPEVQVGAEWRHGRMYSEPYLKERQSRLEKESVKAPTPTIDVRGRMVVGDPHVDTVDEMWILDKTTLEWKLVAKGRGRR